MAANQATALSAAPQHVKVALHALAKTRLCFETVTGARMRLLLRSVPVRQCQGNQAAHSVIGIPDIPDLSQRSPAELSWPETFSKLCKADQVKFNRQYLRRLLITLASSNLEITVFPNAPSLAGTTRLSLCVARNSGNTKVIALPLLSDNAVVLPSTAAGAAAATASSSSSSSSSSHEESRSSAAPAVSTTDPGHSKLWASRKPKLFISTQPEPAVCYSRKRLRLSPPIKQRATASGKVTQRCIEADKMSLPKSMDKSLNERNMNVLASVALPCKKRRRVDSRDVFTASALLGLHEL